MSELIQKAMRDLGLTMAPWQIVIVEKILEGRELVIYPRQYGRTSINAVVEKARELMNEPLKGRTSGKSPGGLIQDPFVHGFKADWTKGGPVPHASVRQVLAWIDEGTDHAQVTVRQQDWDRLWRVIASQAGEKTTLKQRITNQRRQLRGLNQTITNNLAWNIRFSDARKIEKRVTDSKIDARIQTIARLELELNDAKQAADHAEQALASARTGLESRDAQIKDLEKQNARLETVIDRKNRAIDYWSQLIDYALHDEKTKKAFQLAIHKFDKKRRKEGKQS